MNTLASDESVTVEKPAAQVQSGRGRATRGLSNLIQFGQEVHNVGNKLSHSNFSPKTIEAYVIYYVERSNTYRCATLDRDEVVITSNVIVAPRRKDSRKNCISEAVDNVYPREEGQGISHH